ncbi:MAG: hypothetical protein ACREX4_23645, partial [Gammaproteobacteria bacterium]
MATHPASICVSLRGSQGIDEDRQILASHVIESSVILSYDFRPFFLARGEALLTRIVRATRKLIPRNQPSADT